MRPKIIYLFMLSLCLMSISSSAQSNSKYKAVILEGKLSEMLMKNLRKDPYIFYYTEYIPAYTQNAIKIPVQIQGNTFKSKIPMTAKIGYFGLGNSVIRSGFGNLFLIEPGDSLFCVSENTWETKFTGKGAERANYQVPDLKNLLPVYSTDFNEPTQYLHTLLDSLNSKKIANSKKIYSLPYTTTLAKQIIELNTYGYLEINYIGTINSLARRNEVNDAQIRLTSYEQRNNIDYEDIAQNSFMLTLANYSVIKAASLQDGKDVDAIADAMLKRINKNYTGLMRDRLIAITFLRFGGRSKKLLEILPTLIKSVSDTLSLTILEEIANTKLTGKQAYPFSFTGINGEKITLTSFKGKIIILDTWFNGCLGCVKLAEHMDPIAKYFYSNKDVVFLSINAVDEYNRFLTGVSEGKYGSAQTIYGYTGGLGTQHPMIKFYQYKSFPNILIIGKTGNIISSNPIWPTDKIKTKEFIKLIEHNF